MLVGWFDCAVIGLVIAAIVCTAVYTKRFMRSSADFLAANRLAGRYLLTIASGFLGAISIVNLWEFGYATGLPPRWWGVMGTPIGTIIMLSGFVIYRYRQTRSLTLAQFFEMRYSRNFRFFAGILCWLSGLLNYGIFPMVTAKFLMNFIGLPARFEFLGIEFGTFSMLMIGYLAVAVYISCSGGMISIMINGFLQNSFVIAVLAAILLFTVFKFGWGDLIDGLKVVEKPGTSLIDPFMTSTTREFDLSYFLIGLFGAFYGVMVWQGNSGYGSAAKTPHEAVMSNVIGSWRGMASAMCMIVVPMAVYAFLHLDKYGADAVAVKEAIAACGDARIQAQMTVPITMSHLLPSGLFGLFVAVILCCAITCDSTYTHSWGTILIQDVIAPMRGKPFTPKTHMLVMRLAIIGVAVFGFIFSELYTQKSFITMYFTLTAAIYAGGAGAVIIGGLYWKHGTTAAAWTAMSIGTVTGFGGLVIVQIWEDVVAAVFAPAAEGLTILNKISIAILALGVLFAVIALLMRGRERFRAGVRNLTILALFCVILSAGSVALFSWLRTWAAGSAAAQDWLATSPYVHQFYLTEAWIGFYASIFSVVGYIAVSLLGRRSVHDMDKLLHRGKYAILSDSIVAEPEKKKSKFSFASLVGIGDGFTAGEKFLFIASFTWTMLWWVLFVIGCIVRIYWDIPEKVWSWFWGIQIYLNVVIGVGCTVWILLGGLKNARELFSDLRKTRVDENDDGFVR